MSSAYTKLISSSYSNVLSLDNAKDSLRIPRTDTEQDTLITSCLNAAIRFAETRTERIITESVFEIRIPAEAATIVLPFPDFLEITKVEEMDESNVRTDLFVKDPASGTLSDYLTLDDWLNPAEVTVIEDNLSSTAEYLIITASFGMGSSTPDDLLNAIKMMLNHFFDNPKEVEVGRIASQVPMGADTIFSLYQFKRFQ